MEFIAQLQEWYARCRDVKVAMKLFRFIEEIDQNQPLAERTADDFANTITSWLAIKAKHKFVLLQSRIAYPHREKTYYVGLKWGREYIVLEYVHDMPFVVIQAFHRWHPDVTYVNLTLTEICNSVERAEG